MLVASIRRFPHKGAIALVVFALGLGVSCTAVVVVALDQVVLRPFPMTDPKRVVFLRGLTDHPSEDAVEWWSRSRSLQELAEYATGIAALSSASESEWIQTTFVSPRFFAVFGIRPSHGRLFGREDILSVRRVAVLAQSFAASHFGGPAAALGRDVRVNGELYQVLGVLPRGFTFPGHTDLWLPRPRGPTAFQQVRAQLLDSQSSMLTPSEAWIGKLRPGVTPRQAGDELLSLLRVLDEASRPRGIRAGTLASARPFHQVYGGGVRPALVLLLLGGLFLLAAAVASSSSILLGVALQRQTEFAVRQALGASLWQIVSHILTESSALGVFSGVLASIMTLNVAQIIHQIVRSYVPELPGLGLAAPLACISCVTAGLIGGSLMGLASTAVVRHNTLAAALQGRVCGYQLSHRILKALTISQISVAFALSVAGLASIGAYARVHWASSASGVRPEGVFWLRLATRGQVGRERYVGLQDEVLHAIGGVQGVAKAALTDRVWWLAPSGGLYRAVVYSGEQVMCLSTGVKGPYFDVTGIRLKCGSHFNRNTDNEVIVDEEFARRMGGEQAAVGQALRVDGEAAPRTIVGVAQSASAFGGERTVEPQCYFPLTGRFASAANASTIEVLVRCNGRCPGAMTAIRDALRRVPGVSLYAVVAIADAVERALGPFRVRALLLALYALVTGALALVGVYGLLSALFAARRHEIALRLALGATRVDILRAVCKEAIGLTAAGVLAGGVVALALGTILSSQVFQMRSASAAALLGTAFAFLVMAVLATLPVGLRLARQEPWEILKVG